jgi:integrase
MPRTASLKPVKVNVRGEDRFLVHVPKDQSGKPQQRRYFRSQSAADKFAKTLRDRRDQFGKSLSILTVSRTVEAAEVYATLEAAGFLELGLRRVVAEWLEQRKARESSTTWQSLVTQYLAARSDRNPLYLTQVEACANKFNLSDRKLVDITVADFETELQKLTAGARRQFIVYLRAIFAYGIKRHLLTVNVAKSLEAPRQRRSEPMVMTLYDVETLLYVAQKEDSDLLAYLAVCFFSGLRPGGEALRLEWTDIREGKIVLPAAYTKKHKRRVIDVSPNLAAWLAVCPDQKGRLLKMDKWTLDKRRAKLCATARVEWHQDVSRHSYASYHLAHFRDRETLAQNMGHSNPRILETHYIGVVDSDSAELYWRIVPQQATGQMDFALTESP